LSIIQGPFSAAPCQILTFRFAAFCIALRSRACSRAPAQTKHAPPLPFPPPHPQVSNEEYYAFVSGGGYRTLRFWSAEGWHWRAFRNAKWPTFWVPAGPEGLHQYRLRLNFDVLPMAWALPVEVNWHEAHAYCSWLAERDAAEEGEGQGQGGAYRLTTEGEHHRMRAVREAQRERERASGETVKEREGQWGESEGERVPVGRH
jgi:formylglycine-generating enzyme required for sulfatase activity